MDLQHARLHQRDQAIEAIDRDDVVALLGDQVQMVGADAAAGVLLEEALPGVGAFGAAHQCDGAADQVRRHPLPHCDVIVGELAFGDAGILPIDAVGMRQDDAGDGVIGLCLGSDWRAALGRRSRRGGALATRIDRIDQAIDSAAMM